MEKTDFMKWWLIRNKRFVGAVFIFAIALFFRGYNLAGQFRWWNGDTSRDVLMARHIAFLGDRPITGPDIAGGAGYLVNSPVYYYLLALVCHLIDNIFTVPYFFIFVDSVAVAIGYWIMSEFSLGLATVISVAIAGNCYLDTVLKLSTQPFLLPLITILAIFFWLKSTVSDNLSYFLVYIFICILSLHVHYAELTLFPMFFVGGVWVFLKNNLYGKNWWKVIVWTMLWFLSWWLLTYKIRVFDQYVAVGLIVKNHYSWWQLLDNIKELHLGVIYNMLGISNVGLAVLFWVVVYFGGGWMTILMAKKQPLYWFVYLTMCSINLTIPMGGYKSVVLFYIYPYYLILFLELFLFLNSLRKYVWSEFVYFLAALCMLMSVNFSVDFGFIKRLGESNGEVELARKLTDVIYYDSKLVGDSYDLVYSDESTQNGRFGTSIFWYFLEKKSNKKLVKVVDGEEHSAAYFVPVSKTSKNIYLVCADRFKTTSILQSCENSFLSKSISDGVEYGLTNLAEDDSGQIGYKLVRFQQK